MIAARFLAPWPRRLLPRTLKRLRVARVHLRGRGRDLIHWFNEVSGPQNKELAVFCDVNVELRCGRAAECERTSGKKPQMIDHLRRVMDEKNIAAAFATPNHWLALGTIWARQTGKDVYCEKPGTHKFREGL